MPNTLSNTPQAGNTLSADQGNMLQNNNYYANTLGKDHQVGPTTSGRTDTASFEGRHIQVSFKNRGGTIAVPGDGTSSVLYDNAGNLVWSNTAGVTGILGANNIGYPRTATNGSSWLPGTGAPFQPIAVQWGQASKATDGVVSFNPAFSNTPYSIQLTPLENGNSRLFLYVKTLSSTQFTVAARDASGNDTTIPFSWFAVGPM